MRAKITKPEGFWCAPTGAIEEFFAIGTVVDGQIAVWALRNHAAARLFDPREETKVVTPPETKRGRKPKK